MLTALGVLINMVLHGEEWTLIAGFQCHAIQNKNQTPFNRLSPESEKRKKVSMQRLSLRFRSQYFFL